MPANEYSLRSNFMRRFNSKAVYQKYVWLLQILEAIIR